MEKKFYNEEFEQFLRDSVENFQMFPSRKVWYGIYNDLHPSKKWPSLAITLILVSAVLFLGISNNNAINRNTTKNGAKTLLAQTNPNNINSTNITAHTPSNPQPNFNTATKNSHSGTKGTIHHPIKSTASPISNGALENISKETHIKTVQTKATLPKPNSEQLVEAPLIKNAIIETSAATNVQVQNAEMFEEQTNNATPTSEKQIEGNQNSTAVSLPLQKQEEKKETHHQLNDLQKESDKPLKIATIFSFAANEEQSAIGEIADETFEPSAMDVTAKEFLTKAINDYNAMFKTSYSVDSNEFQNYYRDLAKRVKNKEVDLLIVVGMFLTGFDAPTLNTLFVDKNLRYHGLIQAFSRTNRIYDATKTFGNIVTFRDLELATIDAITLFGDSNTKNVVLEKSYKEYLEGFTDIVTGVERRGYVEVVKELNEKFPNPDGIVKEKDKKEFVKLFGEYLRIENILQNYDEFNHLKALHAIDINNPEAIEEFKKAHFVTDEDIVVMLKIELLNERIVQDYRSTYNDIRDWLRREKSGKESEESTIDWDDVVFEVDLLKSQEINLDYILELIFEHNKKTKNKADLIDEIRRVIRASVGNRAKESLVIDFINETDLDTLQDKANVIESFFMFAQKKQKEDAQALIREENLNEEAAKRYITSSLKREYASENGTELNALLPKMSPLNPQYLTKKQSVFQKLVSFVEKFKGVGGQL